MKGNGRSSSTQSNHKFHRNKLKKRSKKETKIDIETDERFADFTKPEKRPPVDMFGRPVSPDALEKYESSSDDEIEMLIPPDARPSEDEEAIYSNEIFRRIAVVNQPWKDISAQDIFQYFYMNMGDHNEDLLSVTVFLSNYGQTHPETEAPPPTDSEEIEIARWRKRGEDEFKRYFAICEFKDAKTADLLYKAMRNIGISDEEGGFFDLQFVNDDMGFDSFPIRDEAHGPIDNWVPPEIYCPFLTKTKNNDTWDSAPRDRINAFKSVWEAINNDSDDEIAESLLIGSGSEDEEKPTRAALQGTLDALENEEEDENESDSEEKPDFKVDFVQEEAKSSEKAEEDHAKNKKHKKRSKEAAIINEAQPVNDEDTIKSVMEDDRFKDLFAKPGYGIDTSDPNFKRTELMDKFMTEVSKKHMEVNKDTDKQKKQEESGSALESTVERLRRRAAMRANSNKK